MFSMKVHLKICCNERRVLLVNLTKHKYNRLILTKHWERAVRKNNDTGYCVCAMALKYLLLILFDFKPAIDVHFTKYATRAFSEIDVVMANSLHLNQCRHLQYKRLVQLLVVINQHQKSRHFL